MKLRDERRKEEIVNLMNQGVSNPFWNLLCQYIDELIEKVNEARESNDLVKLPAEEYKIMSELLRRQIAHLHSLKNLPEEIAMELEGVEQNQEDQNLDPY